MAKINNGGKDLTPEQRQKVIEGALALRAANKGARPGTTPV